MNTTPINTDVLPFKATAFHKGEFIEVTEASLKGKWSVIFFYPADFTFVCPTELGDLADSYAEFQKLGVEIYAVSTDTHFTHKAWHDASATIKKIEYPMIGDPTGTITRNFGVMIEAAGLAERGTFVINPEGKITLVEISAGGVGRDANELLRKIRAAQYVATHPGEVCPAKWQEGAATLAPSLELVGKI
jgi:peroxiredoxin (alkyl hydroperoxide reductase subunit C)